jgi:tetratricopeptide (TPR) repeat protein
LGGRLRVVRRLGEGSTGVVYEAFDRDRNARVAFKTMSRLDAVGVYRIKHEFRALADLAHPNLLRLHELFVDDDTWLFTMELVEGEPFDRFVRPAQVLDEARLGAALLQLFAAVFALHDSGKLHCDLKPSNVLVERGGRVVVLDFGLAVGPEAGAAAQTRADGAVRGTPGYMAPEQAAGEPARATTDYYALGAMLFEALTGRLPFEGRPGAVLASKQRLEAPCVLELAPHAPRALARLCGELLAREPAARPSRAQIEAALEALVGPDAEHIASTPARAPSMPPLELLGREAELGALRDAYRATLAGRPCIMFLTGESGIGKSALVEAFAAELRAQGEAVVLAGRCHERENVPFKALDALIDALSRHLRKLPAAAAAALMSREVFALARIFPVLGRVPAVADAPHKHVPDPQDLKRRATDAFAELLGRMRDRSPLVLLIDDLQWIDQDSARFIRAWLKSGETPPLLLVCVHRSEGARYGKALQSVHEAAREQVGLDVRRLELSALAAEALVALVRRLLPKGMPELVEERSAATLAREAQGSPFFAKELARALPLAGPLFDNELPRALELSDAIALHVALLPLESQRLLSVLALAGKPLAPALAFDAAGMSDGASALDRLRGDQLVRVSFDDSGARTLECYHDKIREQIARGLDALSARELALGLTRAVLKLEDADFELLARALELAGLPEQAAEHAVRAAERAFSLLAFDRAAALYERALAHGRFEHGEQLRLRTARAEALSCAGQGERAASAFLEAAELAAPERRHELTRRAGEQYLLRGDLDRGRVALAGALGAAGVAFPRNNVAALVSVTWSRARLRARGHGYTARAEHAPDALRELEVLRTVTHALVRSDLLCAADFSARWLRRALDAGHAIEISRALAWERMFTSLMNAPDERVENVDKACEQLCEQLGDRTAMFTLEYARGVHYTMRMAQPERAIQCFDRALELLQAHPSPTTSYDRAWAHAYRAGCLMTLGRFRQAHESASTHLEEAIARGDHTVSAFLTNVACFCAIAADLPDQCRNLLDRAASRFRGFDGTLQEALWHVVQPLPALYEGDVRRAWYDAAPQRTRFLRTFTGRFMSPGLIEHMMCGVAALAAKRAGEAPERRELERTARAFARRASGSHAVAMGAPAEALACLDDDYETAIALLRVRIEQPTNPISKMMLRRRLGELLGGAEGANLIAGADRELAAGGVVDCARFTATFMVGVER